MLLHPGSTGDDVARLETRLTQLGFYAGSADHIYSTDLKSAVKAFQSSAGLQPDGVAGDHTWAALFPPAPAPLVQRCLALTGTFETSTPAPDCYAGLNGDFDGQGLSFGVLQWNIGQDTLQPLFAEMLASHEAVIAGLFNTQMDDFRAMLAAPRNAQLAWARGIQDPLHHTIAEPWNGLLKALGRTPEFQAIQANHAAAVQQAALQLCAGFGVTTERGLALMFDIRVQNGSISPETEAKIRTDFAAIPATAIPMDAEVAKLRSIANRRAEASKPAFIEDVRTRKLTIANGSGTVHGIAYDLERQFGIGLTPLAAA